MVVRDTSPKGLYASMLVIGVIIEVLKQLWKYENCCSSCISVSSGGRRR